MTDKLKFEKTVLPNGITTYFKKLDEVEFTTVYIQVPVGTAHSIKPFLPGTFHFLEYICLESSQGYKNIDGFGQFVGLKGGWTNAHTQAFSTNYEISIPSVHFEEVVEGFFNMVFKPAFREDAISLHKDIINNESKSRRWYPGDNEIGNYLSTGWKWMQNYPKEMIYGDEKSLAKMNAIQLEKTHKTYFDSKIIVVAAGANKITSLKKLLTKIETQNHKLPNFYELPKWVNQDYHEKSFRDIDRFELFYGGFACPLPDMQTVRRLNFIGWLLTNQVQGSIYNWLRKDLGWTYEIGFYSYYTKDYYDWVMRIPLNNPGQVKVVREEIWERAKKAIKNKKLVKQEVERVIGGSVYWYLSPDQIAASALEDLNSLGKIVTVSEWKDCIALCGDLKALEQVFEKYFSEKNIGSMCAFPQAR